MNLKKTRVTKSVLPCFYRTYYDFYLIWAVLLDLLLRSPLLIVSIVGIVVALTRRRRHPRTSFYTIVSLAVTLVLTIFTSFIYKLLPFYLYSSLQYTAEQAGYIFGAINFVTGLISAATLGLLLLAIFGERGGANPNR